ncbi:hypothetical protein MP619_04980 [Streptococcus dysgalactiae]|uniref:Hyaluronoglucosaminidase n=1 Tax=Streptococcus dysgalactiae TaxID=1334 RepID=A0AAF0A292_STRDY|nr:hypothetical protein [Streptococcus dysgalactiae]WAI93953.1 hypothetical protein MP619_04980 [Streptococcus dysgalactiae]
MTLEERIPIKVLFDRKDAAEWQRLNPVIDDGELVVELDTHRLKVGDGKLNYNGLPYYEGPQGESITKVQLSENGDLSVWIGEKETKLGNIKGQKGDKGTSITDITKDGETLTITLSDDTQKTFSIPNGQKGDRGKSVESARVDESGHLRLKIEEEQEKDLGNVKGDKGSDGAPGLDGPRGATGPAGVGITNTTIRYATGTLGTTVPRYGEWFTTPPYVPEGQFLWTEVVWQYSNGTTQTAYSVSKMGEQGPIGPQGPPGQQGMQGRQGPAGRDAVLNVEVVSSAPSYQSPGVIYLVRDGK